MRRTRGTQPLARATVPMAPSVSSSVVSLDPTSLRSRLACFSDRWYPPQTVRVATVEVTEALPSHVPGQVIWLSDFVCFRVQPFNNLHTFRKSVRVVPRNERHDAADYVIGLRLFHEGENQ